MDYIFIYLQSLGMLFSLFILCEKRIKLLDILVIILMSFINITLYQYVGIIASLTLYLCLLSVAYYIERNVWLSIIISTFIYTLTIVSDHISVVILNTLNVNDTSSYLYLILSLITLFTPLLLMIKLIGRKLIVSIKNTKIELFIGAISLITSIIFFANIYLSRFLGLGNDLLMVKINLISFLVFLIILGLIIILYTRTSIEKIKINQDKKDYESLVIYTNEIENQYSEIRKFRHDYENVISSLDSYLLEKDYTGLNNYYNQYIKQSFTELSNNSFKLQNLVNIKSKELKSIFATKLIKAQELNIDVSFECHSEISELHVNPIYLIRILGIILDNAIEEASTIEGSRISAAIINENKSILIVVENTCSSNEKKLFELKQEGYSTKENHSGLGLVILDEILKKNPNLYLETSINSNSFIQKISILY